MKASFGAMAASSVPLQAHELTVWLILMPEAPTICWPPRCSAGQIICRLRPWGFSLDHGTGLTFSGITGGLAFVVVLPTVDHQCLASYRRFSAIQLDHAVENLGTQNAVGANPLIWHIARPFPVRYPCSAFVGLKCPPAESWPV